FDLFSDQAKLRNIGRVKLVLVPECYWPKRQDRFTCLIHRFDLVFETFRGGDSSEVSSRIDNYTNASGYRRATNPGDKGCRLCSLFAEAYGMRVRRNTGVPDVDIIVARVQV